ncbi:MAG: PLP-dependent aminotransferase family protein [Actinobacteria bacterium]|nr:PLP-dependent aminotransferase family protein [Actinomycetota bacterium]
MSPEVIFDPFTNLYSKATRLVKSSEIRDLMSITGRHDIISFAGGLPYIDGLPKDELASVMESVLQNSHTTALQYGSTEGLVGLKSHLADLMSEEGLDADTDYILITSGSQQALDLLSRVFIDPGDSVVVEGPTYVGALSAFRPNNPEFITVPLDENGIQTNLLRQALESSGGKKPKFIYVVPNFHNPAGVTMSMDRRLDLIEIAHEYDLLIIEDNPYGLLRFEGKPLPTLASIDRDKVIYVGTLSKIVSPGIRVGWVLAPSPIIEKLAKLKQSADLCSSNLSQTFAEEYLQRGLFKKNIPHIREIYRVRRDAMLSSLEENFPEGASWAKPGGGLFIWANLPSYLDTAKMLPLAIEKKVAFVPGGAFYHDGSGRNNMRLNFSFPSPEEIYIGIEKLGTVIRKEMELYRSLGISG